MRGLNYILQSHMEWEIHCGVLAWKISRAEESGRQRRVAKGWTQLNKRAKFYKPPMR